MPIPDVGVGADRWMQPAERVQECAFLQGLRKTRPLLISKARITTNPIGIEVSISWWAQVQSLHQVLSVFGGLVRNVCRISQNYPKKLHRTHRPKHILPSWDRMPPNANGIIALEPSSSDH
jgi:hypothetical protein